MICDIDILDDTFTTITGTVQRIYASSDDCEKACWSHRDEDVSYVCVAMEGEMDAKTTDDTFITDASHPDFPNSLLCSRCGMAQRLNVPIGILELVKQMKAFEDCHRYCSTKMEEVKGMLICEHAVKCDNEECPHREPHEEAAGCDLMCGNKLDDGLLMCVEVVAAPCKKGGDNLSPIDIPAAPCGDHVDCCACINRADCLHLKDLWRVKR